MAMATRRVVPVSSPPQPRREYWRALVDAHRRSGLSQAAFCRRRGIPTGTLSLGMSRSLLNLAERGGSGAQHTALATVVKIAEARS
jgi:hypothetical protein